MRMDEGKVLPALAIGESVDATKMEEGKVFANCRDGSLSVANAAKKVRVVQVVKTGPCARTMGTDLTTHSTYLLPEALVDDHPSRRARR